MTDQIPAWAMERAEAIFHNSPNSTLKRDIALALLSVQRETRQQDAKVVKTAPMRFAGQTETTIRANMAAAIRSLSDEVQDA